MSYQFDFVDADTGQPVTVTQLTFSQGGYYTMRTIGMSSIAVDLTTEGQMLAGYGVTFYLAVSSRSYDLVQLTVPAEYPEQVVPLRASASGSMGMFEQRYVPVPAGVQPIALSSLNGGTELPDHDRIEATLRPDTGNGLTPDPNMMRLELTAMPQAHWWKGVYLWDGYRKIPWFELFTIIGSEFIFGPDFSITESLSARIPLTELANKTIILSKAKTFGWHTDMYALDTGHLPLAGGSVLSFNWINQG
jgi:hypothetical protein